MTPTMQEAERNWAGNVTFSAGTIHRPAHVDEVQEIVANADRVRAVGSRHSFSDIADSAELIDLSLLDGDIRIDEERRTVTLPGGTRYSTLARALDARGWALPNLASLPHISVAGSVATGTHGSGDANRVLSADVRELELVTGAGSLARFARGDADFDGVVVGIGALGVVTSLTLDIVPTFMVRQDMYAGLTWARLTGSLDDILASAYSVSITPDWQGENGRIRRKSRDLEGAPEQIAGARRTTNGFPVHTGATDQLGATGAWLDRLPHFRAEHEPSYGDEVQSEWFVRRSDGAAALEALRPLGGRLTPDVLWSAEIRSVAADELWLSGAYRRDTVGIHFTWRNAPDRVAPLVEAVSEALAPFTPRPHWAKLDATPAGRIRAAYPRFDDFAALRRRLDPSDTFLNPWLERLLGL